MPEMQPHETFDGKPATFEVPDFLPDLRTEPVKIGVYDAALLEDFHAEADKWGISSPRLMFRARVLAQDYFNLAPGESLVLRDQLGFQQPIDYLSPEYFLTGTSLNNEMRNSVLTISAAHGTLLIAQHRKLGISREEAFERNIRMALHVAKSQREKGLDVFFAPAKGSIKKRYYFPDYKDQEK